MSDLRAELQRIREEAGQLTPAAVVAAAKPRSHPLHSRFEWDDKAAGHGYRLMQAQRLIRVVKLSYIDTAGNPERIRFYTPVPRPSGTVYEETTEVASDEFAAKLVLNQMERDWRSLKRRYEKFAEFRELVLGDMEAVS